MKLIRNRVQCLSCKRVLESKYRHDFKQCKCENQTFTDGGLEYQRYGGRKMSKIRILSEYFNDSKKTIISLDGKELTVDEYNKINKTRKVDDNGHRLEEGSIRLGG
jgi:hypothetical protein